MSTFLNSPSSSHSPRPRLRSCLSPTRALTSSPTSFDLSLPPSSSSASRSTSFSSTVSGSGSDAWIKRTKCVRWQEMNGCAVTSTHHTYSQEEYDRTPLEPPSIAERDCVLPERGSRCLSSYRDCFYSDLSDTEDVDEDVPSSTDITDESNESLFLHTPPSTEVNSDEEDLTNDNEGEEGEDREWEECMERRRMMFARMCPRMSEGEDRRHPEFEGYRSITSTLADLLRSVGCEEEGSGESFTPLPTPICDDEAVFGITSIPSSIDTATGSSGLQLRRFTRDHDEIEEVEVDTPSLASSTEAESEIEISIQSPASNLDNVHSGFLPFVDVPSSPSPISVWSEVRMKIGQEEEMRGRSRIDMDGRMV